MSNPLGGLPPMRPDQLIPSTAAGVAPGAAAAVLRVTEIIITPGSALEGIFTYSSDPGALGTLIESASVEAAGTDTYGNHYLAGHSSYAAGFATSLQAGIVAFYTGSLAAGWTYVAELSTDTNGDLAMTTAGGSILLAANGDVTITGGGTVTMTGAAVSAQSFTSAGDTSVEGTLFVGGSDQTSTNGLPNGGIQGTSGSASAGTAHTHGPGSYSVTNGMHAHTL